VNHPAAVTPCQIRKSKFKVEDRSIIALGHAADRERRALLRGEFLLLFVLQRPFARLGQIVVMPWKRRHQEGYG
jgi:hypothetical protein